LGLGHGWSLLAIVAAVVLAFTLLVWWRGPGMADQASRMLDQLARQAEQIWGQLKQSPWGGSLADQLRGSAESAGFRITGYVGGVASSALGIGGSLVVVLATGLFLAASPESYLHGALRLLPPSWRSHGEKVAAEIGNGLQLWFLGQLIDMIVVGVLVGIGLLLLGVPFAPTLALFAALLNFVPYVGALAGAVPAVMVAFAQSSTLALWVGLLFAAIQTLEGNVIAPLIQKRTVSLPPALTLMSQTILGTLFGVIGLVLAMPLSVGVLIGIRIVYVEYFLERKAP
jgi:predicted PurR-regulated permease PerM